jgi:hypothetical protein
MPRPRTKIDLAELEKLAGMQCTIEEIAAFFDVSPRTIERRRNVPKFLEAMERGKAKSHNDERCSILLKISRDVGMLSS